MKKSEKMANEYFRSGGKRHSIQAIKEQEFHEDFIEKYTYAGKILKAPWKEIKKLIQGGK